MIPRFLGAPRRTVAAGGHARLALEEARGELRLQQSAEALHGFLRLGARRRSVARDVEAVEATSIS
jgi:hypothetical protein